MKKKYPNQIVNLQNNFSLVQNLLFLTLKRVLLLLVFITSNTFGQSNNCQAELKVEDNGNIRSTPLDGTYYSMIISNLGSSPDIYTLSKTNINSICTNMDGSDNAGNVIINTSFIDPDKNTITQITVNPGESVNFYIHVTVPVGTVINKWSCTQVIANSKNCPNYLVDAILHTYVIDLSKD